VETPIEHKFFDSNIHRRQGMLEEHIENSDQSGLSAPTFSLIEFNLSGLCNRTCVFCPRSNPEIFPNLNEHIPVELYENIMKQLAEFGYDGLIVYSGFGEPLLYKQIDVLIKITKTHCPEARIECNTDGDFVTPEKLRVLFEAGLDALLISMYDGPEQVEEFKQIIAEAGLESDQVILRPRWLPPEEHYGITLNNRSGMVEIPDIGITKLASPIKRRCFYPSYQVFVDYDGSVLICPNDWGKKLIAGNLHRNTVNEIWNGRIMKRVRLNLANADRNFAPCDNCDVDGTLIGERHFNEWMEFYKRDGT